MIPWLLEGDAAIKVFPIRDSNALTRGGDWRDQRAYYFTGLEYRMLVCPFFLAADEPLLQRAGLYLKTSLPLGAIVFFPHLPTHHNRNDFVDGLDWIVDSYLFRFHATRPPADRNTAPRLYVDHVNMISIPRPEVFDEARIIATQAVREMVAEMNHRYSEELLALIRSRPEQIRIANWAQTTLSEEVCAYRDFIVESKKYLDVVVTNHPQALTASALTGGFEHITCSRRYCRTALSFYLAAIKEPFPNSPGSYIGMFKNLYSVLEYMMAGDGKAYLRAVLDQRVGIDRLRGVLADLKASAGGQSALLQQLTHGEQLSGDCFLPPLSEDDPELAERVAARLYTKRNAVLHSKKTFRGQPIGHNVSPGRRESFLLETDLALMRPIAEIIVSEADPNE